MIYFLYRLLPEPSTKERMIFMNLNPNAAIDYAKQFTITAMEHSMITHSTDPKKTAENVAEFFETMFSALSGKEKS